MTVSWNSAYDYNDLVARIEQSRKLSADGKVSFSGFEFEQYQSLLHSMLLFSAPIPEAEIRGFIWQAAIKVGKKGKITAKSLLAEIKELTNIYLQKPLERFVLVTTISIGSHITFKRIRYHGFTILLGANLSKTFIESRAKLEGVSKPTLVLGIPDNYIYVKVYVLARSIYEAADLALDSLDVVRGTWNWFLNRRHSIRMSFGSRKPVNKIVLGPLHTLHFPNGKLATEIFWYETKRYGNLEPFDITQDVGNLYKFLLNVRKRLTNLNYEKTIENALVLYTRALDEWDWDGAFLKLWSVLEQLTNYDDNYKVTIKRASFLFIDRNFSKQVLSHLKDYRNKYVHKAADNSEIETYLYQLKNIVEHLLSFHLSNKLGFKSMQEATEYLDLPSDKKELVSRIRMMKYAQKYLKHV